MLPWLASLLQTTLKSSGRREHGSKEEQEVPLDTTLRRLRHIPSDDILCKMAAQRVSFYRCGAVAMGRPSSGGLLYLPVNAVDLVYLGVSRLEPTLESEPYDPAAEDTWCARLHQLSPRWAPSENDKDLVDAGGRPSTELEQQSVYVAWCSSNRSVWVLKCQRGREPPGLAAAYDLCLSMDERCALLEKCGAQLFADPHQCPELDGRNIDDYKKQRRELDWSD